MNPNLSNVIFHILNNLKDKEFSYHSDDTSSPTFGRQGNEFFITNGKLAGPFEIKVINSNTVECTIKVSWHSKRCKYEFIQTATENRTDYAIYIFTATLDDSTQIVSIKEVDWIPFDKDPTFQSRLDINYRAAVYAKKGLEERLIQPLSGHIKSLSSETPRFSDKESFVSYFRDHYNIHVVLQGDFMAGVRNINLGSGNYNERIEGNYVQGNYREGKQSHFNLQDAQFGGGLVNADTVDAHQIGGNITNYTSQQQQNPELVKTILILAANPKTTSRLRLDEEVREIDAGLQRAKKRELFDLKQRWAVRVQDVYQSLLDFKPQIVHFSGHGAGDDGLVLEDETGNIKLVDTQALAGLFELFAPSIECVILNACYSEVQAQAIANHIPYVIGMSKEIGDQAAIKFATGFYNALVSGESIEFAYKLGCSVVQLEGIPEHLTPVLKKNNNLADKKI